MELCAGKTFHRSFAKLIPVMNPGFKKKLMHFIPVLNTLPEMCFLSIKEND